jgi:hypothetical protein
MSVRSVRFRRKVLQATQVRLKKSDAPPNIRERVPISETRFQEIPRVETMAVRVAGITHGMNDAKRQRLIEGLYR